MISVDSIEYRDGGTTFEAFVAYDRNKDGKRPAILVMHDWMGVGPFVRGRPKVLPKWGTWP